MKQQTLADIEYSNRRRITKREEFLNTMDSILPWSEWVEMVRPYYPSGKRGRRPRGIETMLRMYLMQDWFNLSTPGIEDAINDSYSMRSFLRVDFLREQVPDSTTLLRFHRLLKAHKLNEHILSDVQTRLKAAEYTLHHGTIIDAILVSTPASAKTAQKTT